MFQTISETTEEQVDQMNGDKEVHQFLELARKQIKELDENPQLVRWNRIELEEINLRLMEVLA